MSAQILEIAGEKMAMLPLADYERLLEIAEDQSDINAAIAAEKRRLEGEEYIPAALVYSIMDGENALRAWRQYRGLSLDVLAATAGTNKSQLSLMENGKALGKPALWRALAAALNVAVDDIMPFD
jgi:DNA-binding XRE family transcriptional regulator